MEACISEGVDWVGLNFVPGSPRYVNPEQAMKLASMARGKLRLVGVYQNADMDTIRQQLRAIKFDAAQLHGEETPEFCSSVPCAVWKAFAIHPGWDHGVLHRYKGLAVRLFDTKHSGQSGGTGRVFDWSLLPSNPPRPWFLAGGLTPENLNAAVSTTYPDGVDLNSGVETSPGVKDPARLHQAMSVLARWREGAENGLANAPAISHWIHENQDWAVWAPSDDLRNLDEASILALLDNHPRLVLDFRKAGDCTARVGQFMRIQMQARTRGKAVKFRFSESTISALMRVSMLNSLDILE
jgi:phosphoribosylanthranilate isomerase